MKDEDKTKDQLINELALLRIKNSRLLEDSRGREKHYLSIAQSARNAIISVDSEGQITFFNYAAENIFGYMFKEVIGKPVTMIMPERFRAAYHNGMVQFIKTGKTKIIGRTIELVGLKKDGREFPIEMYISSWKSGRETFFTSNIRDITERKQAEEELRAAKEQLESFINNTADGIAIWDLEGSLLQNNKAFEGIFGWAGSEISGIMQMVPDYLVEEAKRHMEKVVSDGKAITYETVRQRKDKTLLDAIVTLTPIRDSARNIVALASTSRDITERKRQENKLRLAAKVFENTIEGIMLTDTDGLIEWVNPAFTRITGQREEDVINKQYLLVLQGAEEVFKKIHKSLQSTGQWQGEDWLRHKNGEVFPVWISMSAIKDESGATVQYVSMLRDITEQVKMNREKQRLQEQAARAQRLASLSTISAGIAHEINQPLNTMKVIVDGMLYWHKRGRMPEHDKIIKNLEKISAQVGRIDEIIKHMRSLVGSGNATEFEPCNLNKAVGDALGLLGRQLTSHKINVVKKLAKDLPKVLGNAHRLEEVVINLLVNAMQALDKANNISEKEIICLTGAAGEKVILEISDNATGISAEIIDSIFDPFFTTKDTGEGMGLGLAIVQTLLSGFSGQIEAYNNERGGATFRVELPVIKS
ncbi:PAS domain-containing sensor histidine kinase [Pelotomaculum propionicicum]|uniref:histidine kinase n=1 Tax=Pelotomaculum propionicicum TaxID=258475 RepID=A0A4Y7RSD5_9FIRM|nr:PAS domain S-box protein [Pelotomaculum propionicicum]NLI12469.1 PAS domain S-box protein [Peptococcaceae bacterium]TEB11905.1 Sensor protein FixL [Pelotomaculum propionicicum]